jgi:hypothetical protein
VEDLWEVKCPVEELLVAGNALHLFEQSWMLLKSALARCLQRFLCGGKQGGWVAWGMGQKKAAVQVSASQRAAWYSFERR